MFCDSCGQSVREKSKFCMSCGNRLTELEPTTGTQQSSLAGSTSSSPSVAEGSGGVYMTVPLEDYYVQEFSRIHDSGEQYTGKWNWWAFIWGSLWAVFKGAWLSALITTLLIIFSSGILAPFIWIGYGFRGNYLYYRVYKKKEQPIF